MAGSEESQQALRFQTYPVQSRSTIGHVGGTATEVTSMSFLDKIVITVSQDGKIGQWFQVALEPRDASIYAGLPPIGGENRAAPRVNGEGEYQTTSDDGLLPSPHLGVRTLLGGSNEEREILGQMYSTHIANSIMTKRPEENRVLLVGLGLKPGHRLEEDAGRADFFDLMELMARTI